MPNSFLFVSQKKILPFHLHQIKGYKTSNWRDFSHPPLVPPAPEIFTKGGIRFTSFPLFFFRRKNCFFQFLNGSTINFLLNGSTIIVLWVFLLIHSTVNSQRFALTSRVFGEIVRSTTNSGLSNKDQKQNSFSLASQTHPETNPETLSWSRGGIDPLAACNIWQKPMHTSGGTSKGDKKKAEDHHKTVDWFTAWLNFG